MSVRGELCRRSVTDACKQLVTSRGQPDGTLELSILGEIGEAK